MNRFDVKDTKEGKLDRWKDGKYKFQSTFTKGNKVVQYIPFKVKSTRKIANVILVVNDIPVERVFKDARLSFSLLYKFYFLVKPKDETYDLEKPLYFFGYTKKSKDSSDESDDSSNKSNDSSNKSDDSSDESYDSSINKNVSKWDNAEEPVSMTLYFDCEKELI